MILLAKRRNLLSGVREKYFLYLFFVEKNTQQLKSCFLLVHLQESPFFKAFSLVSVVKIRLISAVFLYVCFRVLTISLSYAILWCQRLKYIEISQKFTALPAGWHPRKGRGEKHFRLYSVCIYFPGDSVYTLSFFFPEARGLYMESLLFCRETDEEGPSHFLRRPVISISPSSFSPQCRMRRYFKYMEYCVETRV